MVRRFIVALVCAAPLLAVAGCDLPTEMSNSEFDAAVGSGVTLVDFWATWCPPCRKQGPIVDRIAEAYKGRARVLKVDTDKCPNVARRFGIRSIPTLMVFKDGRLVRTFVGLQSEETLRAALDALLE